MKHAVVSHDEWVEARRKFLAAEKAFTRERDRVSQARRDLPWEEVTTRYIFDGADGPRSLADLFQSRSQLVVYHFMYAPEWDAGCPSCSFWADGFNPVGVHLNHRDVTMGWSFPWYSSVATRSTTITACRSATTIARSIDLTNTAYNYLDLAPKGRDEGGKGMATWLRRHDEYDKAPVA
jgi:predicted dithiol-disulfide oxidoreductase (DUF899 family)